LSGDRDRVRTHVDLGGNEASDIAYSVLVRPGSGDLVVVGEYTESSTVRGAAVVLRGSDGGLATRASAPVTGSELFDATLDGAGNVILAGAVGRRAALLRLTPAGAFDATFGAGGVLYLRAQDDGGLESSAARGIAPLTPTHPLLAVTGSIQLGATLQLALGQVDLVGGAASFPAIPLAGTPNASGTAVRWDEQGRLLVAVSENGTRSLLRLRGDGSADPTFASGASPPGRASVQSLGAVVDGACAGLAVQGDGMIVMLGQKAINLTYGYGVARIWP